MTNRDLIAIGASRGGVEALRFLAGKMPAELPAAVLVTLHLSSQIPSALDKILSDAGPLPAQFATEGAVPEKGRIYIAPPERHLLLDGDRLALGSGPRENFARPAIDPMLRSVGISCGYRAIGVVLTGELRDGAAGLAELKTCGGLTVTQDPADAISAEMPSAAAEVKPDYVVNLVDMPALFESLIQQPAQKPVPASRRMKVEVGIARNGRATAEDMDAIGERAGIVCPDCGGALWEVRDIKDALIYRCHVGHAFNAELLAAALDSSVRQAFGSALRAFSDRLAVTRRLQREAVNQGRESSAETWGRQILELEKEQEAIFNAINLADSLRAKSLRAGR